MSTKSTSPKTESFPGYIESQIFWRSALTQSEAWMKGQPEVLAKIQAAAENWMIHRQDDLGKAVEAYKQICECKDFAEAAAIQQTWFAECVHGLVADWMVLMSPMTDGMRHHSQPKKGASITITKGSRDTTA
jgi:hypothetical protein